MFIVFEGGEGCGKSTQARRLYQYFLDQGKKVILTREPGGTKNAEALRYLVVSDQYEEWPIKAEFLLMLAARIDHYEKLIKPHLEQDYIVICDRFMLSTLAYQGYGRGLDVSWMRHIHDEILNDLKIDKTFVLLLPPENALTRVEKPQRFEALGLAFHQRVYTGFKDLSHGLDVINVEGKDVDKVFDAIVEKLNDTVSVTL